ncbi:MAG: FAD-binding oxidoreductase [Spartobacteria bacterium]|nr:FAD-binding oxidoreductase [Spartobacteria bacterium]
MQINLPSLDGTENITAVCMRPDRYTRLYEALTCDTPVIARGGGLSYCNAGAGRGCRTVVSTCFDRILAFDAEKRLLTVEPGMRLGDLFEFAVRHGLYFPVLPGHPSITVGGCAGFNVHGKTQHNVGHFIDYVERFTLFHPDHGEITCSRTDHESLFRLTIGGFGLTGYITNITLRLIPLKGRSVLFQKRFVANLKEAVEVMKQLSEKVDVLYSWNNLNKTGDAFGEGIVFSEQFIDEETSARDKPFHLFTPDMRSVLRFNFYYRPSAHMECAVYYNMERLTGVEKRCALKATAFPIHGKEIYYLLFGKQGLREYQMLIPHDEWAGALDDLRALMNRMKMPLTLGSMKFFTGAQDLLNYRGDGICLVLDVPANRNSVEYFNKLDEIVIAHKGVVNLSKDSRLTAGTVATMFPEYERFKNELNEFDPKKRFNSALRMRIDV